MKLLYFDYQEFDNSSSEECFIVAKAHFNHFPSTQVFLQETSALPFAELQHNTSFKKALPMLTALPSQIESCLEHFKIIDTHTINTSYVLIEDWDSIDVLFEADNHYFRCYWYTTA